MRKQINFIFNNLKIFNMGENDEKDKSNAFGFMDRFRNAVLGAAMADLPAMMTASGWRLNEKGDYVLDQQNDPHVKLLRDNLAAEGTGVMLGEFGLPALLSIYYTAKGLGKPMLGYGYNLTKKLKDPDMLYHSERNFLPKTLGNTILHPRPNPTGMSDKIWLSEGRPYYTSDGYTIYEIPKNKVITQPSGELFGDYYAGSQVTDQVNLLLDGINVYKYIQFPTHNGLEGVYGLLKFYIPSSLKKVLTAKYPLNKSYFKDKYGREVTPTPYPGPDSELVDAVTDALLAVLRDYFSPNKINQIKKTMNWGDLEISELLDEILRTIGHGSEVQIKGPKDGFTIIGEHQGKLHGTGADAEASHIVTLNRERMPDLLTAQEAGIHEIGVHGKTASMQAEDFGKGGYSDNVKTMFPRLAEITLKNKELADNLLILNKRGLFLDLFKNVGDLEKYFVSKGLSWKDKWDKFYNAFKYYKYTTKADEKTARAYTGQLFNKVFDPNKKTLNIELLERFYTPESVEAFKKAVLGVAPVATAASLVPSDKKGSKILIKKKNRGKFTEYCGGEVTNECILKAKKSKNPTLRKRATFALNARGWAKKHADGGDIAIEGAKTIGGYLPFIGTAIDAYELYKNPSWKQAGWTTLGLLTDIFTGGSARAVMKTARNLEKAKEALSIVRGPITKRLYKEAATDAINAHTKAKKDVLRDASFNIGQNYVQYITDKYVKNDDNK